MADPRLSIGQHSAPAPAALPVCLPEVLHLFEACICVQTMSSNCKPVCHAFNPDTSFVTVSLASGVQCKEVVRTKESKCGSQQLQGPSTPTHTHPAFKGSAAEGVCLLAGRVGLHPTTLFMLSDVRWLGTTPHWVLQE